uniref:Pro-neuregulin-4, membrane-bound isoform n=1 Tax=Fundulus heteroclitus TaxID=8078 RepID=A0A3Q2Q759_FUNHE
MPHMGMPCDPKDATYCMNGGICYTVPSMDHLSCSCPENYKGSRCEEYQLQSLALNDPDKGWPLSCRPGSTAL